jgi:hypothetical protein
MMRRGLAMMAMMACAVAGLVTGGSRAAPALAQVGRTIPTCSNTKTNFAGNFWQRSDNDVEGIRAPIDLRRSGVVCRTKGVAAAWIGIEPGANGAVTQIGFFHYYDPNLGTGRFCKFWENYPKNFAQIYYCFNGDDDVFTYFRISLYNDNGTARYGIDDCGTSGGYNPNCHQEDGTQAAYNNPYGVATAEGQGECQTQIMGSVSDPQKYGNMSYPLEGQTGSGWLQRNFLCCYVPDNCSNYTWGLASEGLRTWDLRVP